MKLEDFKIDFSQKEDCENIAGWISEHDMQYYPFSNDEEMKPFINSWSEFTKHKSSLTASHDSVICAMAVLFLMPYVRVSHHASLWVAVAPDFRRKGIGDMMVKNIIHLAKQYFNLDHINAEIVEEAPLASILKKNGFEPCTRFKNFFKIGENEYHDKIQYTRDLKI